MSEKKWFCGLFVVCVLLVAAGSASNAAEETKDLLAKKVQTLTEWADKEAVIRLTSDRFSKYLRRAPRNYSVIVLLTVLKAERRCVPCSESYEELQIVASSWQYSQRNPNNLFFTFADYDESPSIFESLQIATVPIVMHFPPKGKPKAEDTLQSRGDWSAELIAKWIRERTGVQIQVYRPVNKVYAVAVVAVVIVASVLLYCLQGRLYLIFHDYLLAVLVVTIIFAFISGYMWNQIFHPPSMYKSPGTGERIFIHPDRGSQFGMETYIIMLLYGSMLLGLIMMNEIGSLKWRWAKIILALAGLACFVGFFIMLLTMFKTKNRFYPNGFLDFLNIHD